MQGCCGGAHPAAIVYEPELTLELPAEKTVGTAMNALAHCAEALYVRGHNPAADEHALEGARLITDWLPRVVSAPQALEVFERAAQHLSPGGRDGGGRGVGAGESHDVVPCGQQFGQQCGTDPTGRTCHENTHEDDLPEP